MLNNLHVESGQVWSGQPGRKPAENQRFGCERFITA